MLKEDEKKLYSEFLLKILKKKENCGIDFVWKHVNSYRVILWVEVSESRKLYVVS